MTATDDPDSNILVAFVRHVGRSVLSILIFLGEVVLLLGDCVRSIFVAKVRWKLVLRQMYEIGFGSQMVVIVTGAFTGAVFAAQTYLQFKALGMESAVGAIVTVSLYRELGPVLTALMVAGRAGAAMAAEIGTMKVTEQIDALRALAVYPIDYLVVPRVIAMMISMPLLVAEGVGFGIWMAYFVGVDLMGISKAYFVANLLKYTELEDVTMSMIKACIFGIIIVIVSCYQGLNSEEGAVGVGRATTEAVVVSSLSVLISNFFLTMALNIFFPGGK